MISSPLIEIDKVRKSFDGGRTFAVRDVQLDVARGTFVALVGTSGSGKTTLLKFINRLVEPDAGEVRIGGKSVAGVAPPALRRQIGYVFQGIGLFPHMRVGENIGITPQLLGWAPGKIAARVAELLELVGLPRELCGALSRRSVGRPGPTRERGESDRGSSEHRADGRAVRGARPGNPRRDRSRLPLAARTARPDHHHGDP